MKTHLLGQAAEAGRTLPMSPAWFGILAIAVFALLLAVTFAFRNVGRKH